MALSDKQAQKEYLDSYGRPAPVVSPVVGHVGMNYLPAVPSPNMDAGLASRGVPNFYIPMNIEIAKAYVVNPTNQGQRGGIAARQTMMMDPRNSPSRSQFSEGYTIPIQQFTSNNTWQTPSGQNTAGVPQRQPSTKFVSPFSAPPIPTRMPWDL